MKDDLNIEERRNKLYDAWQRLFNLANNLLAQAEEDITSVKVSMMQQIIRVLAQSGKILDDMEKFQKRKEEEPEIDPETGEEVITPEQDQMLRDFEKLNKGYGNCDEYKDPPVGYGMNFRRT